MWTPVHTMLAAVVPRLKEQHGSEPRDNIDATHWSTCCWRTHVAGLPREAGAWKIRQNGSRPAPRQTAHPEECAVAVETWRDQAC